MERQKIPHGRAEDDDLGSGVHSTLETAHLRAVPMRCGVKRLFFDGHLYWHQRVTLVAEGFQQQHRSAGSQCDCARTMATESYISASDDFTLEACSQS